MLINLDNKICGKCLIEKSLDDFGSDKPKKDGKSTYCKLYNTQRTKQWQSLNKDKVIHPNIVNALANLRPLWATTREINGVIYEGNLNRCK